MGALTEKIVEAVGNEAEITAIEKDSKFIVPLKEKFSSVKIIEGDVLEILPELMELQKGEYALVGNIPYYLTGFLLREVGDSKNRPSKCIFMIQREVAERICAPEGEMNRLSASVQIWGKPEILGFVPRGDFSPPPEVESAIIEINCDEKDRRTDFSSTFRAIRAIFAQPRKTLLNNLSTAVNIPKAKIFEEIKEFGFSENSRPQDVTTQQIFFLAKKFKDALNKVD
jgi:16S rRNA (adenine1518-N6/adenine1519-N6)-dimethyltransferase